VHSRVVNLAFELQAIALIAGEPQRWDAQPTALDRDFDANVAIAARGREELSSVETNESIGLRAAPGGFRHTNPGIAGLTSVRAHDGAPQGHVKDLAQARSRGNEGARVELRALDPEPQFGPTLPGVLRVGKDRTTRQIADDVAQGRPSARHRQLR